MSATTWNKFYWADWESDEKLKMCSPGAQALWMRMLCICAKADGYLVIAGRKLGADDMAAQTGWPLDDVRAWWAQLAKWEVFSVEGRGKVYSRKMIRDIRKAEIARQNGKGGGNPSLTKQTAIPPLDNQKSTKDLTDPPGRPSAILQIEEEISEARASSVAEATPSIRLVVSDPKPIDEVLVAFDEWNIVAAAHSLPKAKTLDKARRAAMRGRLADGGLEAWREALAAVGRSPHCRGANDRGWKADLDFVCQPKSWRRLLEGSYGDDADTPLAKSTGPPSASERAMHAREGGAKLALKMLAERQ